MKKSENRQLEKSPSGSIPAAQTSDKFSEHARRRRENSHRICADPQNFKVCAGCFSVFKKAATLCCFCKGYRWFESVDVVQLIARITEQSALPFNAGVAPRLVVLNSMEVHHGD